MYFLKRHAHASRLFKNLIVLKLPDNVSLENYVFICKYFSQSLPKTWFTLATTSHTHNT